MENWLFWLCPCVGLWVGAKPNEPIVGWQNFKLFCAVGKKLKHEAVGFRVGKKSAGATVNAQLTRDLSSRMTFLEQCFYGIIHFHSVHVVSPVVFRGQVNGLFRVVHF